MDLNYINYMKVLRWISKTSELIRTEFAKRWGNLYNTSWENVPENGTKLMEVMESTKLMIKTFHKEKVAAGDINHFDLPLLVESFKSVILMNTKTCEEEKISEVNILEKLIPVRNEIMHSPMPQIPTETLERMWTIFEVVFKFYGLSETDVKSLKRSGETVQHVQLQQECINTENTKKARKLLLEAENAISSEDPKMAINKCSESLLMAGLSTNDQSTLYCTRSSAFLQLSPKNFDKALQDAKEAITISPNCGKGYAQLAEVYEEQGEFEKSLKNLEIALAFNSIDKAITNARNAIRFKLAVKKNLAEYGTYLLRNFKEAVEEFTKSKGQISTKNFERYKKQLLKGSDPLSLVVQGHQFRDEAEGNCNYAKAAECYQKASEKSNPEALLNLAMLTLHGKGVKKNFEEAIRLLLKASSQTPFKRANSPNYGVGQAGYFHGLYYEKGAREFRKALKAYGSAYENGCGLAAYRAGALLYHRRDFPQLIDEALGLWKGVARNEVFRNQPSNALAYANLVKHYITVEDFEQACIWNMTAIKDGITNILSEDEDEAREMLETLGNAQLYMNLATDGLDDGGMPLGYGPAGIAQIVGFYRVQLDTLKRELLEKRFSDKEELCDRVGPITTYMLPKGNEGKSCSELAYPVEKTKRLKKMAKRGNVVAQRLLDTQNHYLIALDMLLANDTYDDESMAKIVSELARAICLEHHHIQWEQEAKIRLKSMLETEMKNISPETVSDFDRDLRICWAIQVINDGLNYDTVISFLKQSMKKYPNEEFFYDFIGNIYALKQDFETVTREVNIGLQIFPNSRNLLYQKATAQCNLEYLSTETKIEDYLKFFEHALKGDRALPQANYAVSILYNRMYLAEIEQGRNGREARRLSRQYFQKGKEAEKSVPCELPEIQLKLHAEQIFASRGLERHNQRENQEN